MVIVTNYNAMAQQGPLPREGEAFQHYCEEIDDLVDAALQVSRETSQQRPGSFMDVFRECLSGFCYEEFVIYYNPEAYRREKRPGQRRVSEFKEGRMKSNRDSWVEFLRWEVSL